MNKVLIRADGGSQTGLGHIMRTLALSSNLSARFNIAYLCLDDVMFNTGAELIAQKGFEVKRVAPEMVLESINKARPDILITDNYNIKEDYFNKTGVMADKTVYIDDLHCLGFYNVDLLINQNIGAEKLNYCLPDYSQVLAGVKYTMLRTEFAGITPIEISDVKDVLITMGGVDSKNVTKKLLSFFNCTDFNFHVVVGKSYPYLDELKSTKPHNAVIYINPNMPEVMKKCQAAVAACGSTLYELAAIGLPTIGVITADNQIEGAMEMHKNGLITLAGAYSELNKEYMIEMLRSFSENIASRSHMHKVQLARVDVNGAARVAAAVEGLIH